MALFKELIEEIGNVAEESVRGLKEDPLTSLTLGPANVGTFRAIKNSIKRKEQRARDKAERGARDAETAALTEATRQREIARQGALNEKRRRELSAGGSAFASALNLFTQRDPQQLTSLLGRVNDR
jgi:hypothetical protein